MPTGQIIKFITVAVVAGLLALWAAPARAFVVGADGAGDSGCGGRIIVIDPGHGGDDSGAVGPRGVKEKDITLSLAMNVAAAFKESAGCQVLLTRTDDSFVTLEERTAYANRHNADIFISIHVNSTPSKSVHGLETYFLSFDATDEDASRVAAFENRIAGAALDPGAPELLSVDAAGDLRDILLDLATTDAHHESSALADIVHTALVKTTGHVSRGVKQAPFLVLSGAAMPAVLIEAGFISNPSEERWLTSARERTRIAASITEAVITFSRTYPGGRSFIGLNDQRYSD